MVQLDSERLYLSRRGGAAFSFKQVTLYPRDMRHIFHITDVHRMFRRKLITWNETHRTYRFNGNTVSVQNWKSVNQTP